MFGCTLFIRWNMKEGTRKFGAWDWFLLVSPGLHSLWWSPEIFFCFTPLKNWFHFISLYLLRLIWLQFSKLLFNIADREKRYSIKTDSCKAVSARNTEICLNLIFFNQGYINPNLLLWHIFLFKWKKIKWDSDPLIQLYY